MHPGDGVPPLQIQDHDRPGDTVPSYDVPGEEEGEGYEGIKVRGPDETVNIFVLDFYKYRKRGDFKTLSVSLRTILLYRGRV